MNLSDLDWDDLLFSIKKGQCIPFIGAGSAIEWIPLGRKISDEWKEKYNYPTEAYSQLSRIAQYVAIIEGDELAPKNILARRIEEIEENDFPNFSLEKYRNTPYAILADLNLPVYITTNYDHLMEKALKDKGKRPQSETCRWYRSTQIPSVSKKQKKNKSVPNEYEPLVFHLHGDINDPLTMVLTENDYIDFLISLSRDYEILPTIILENLKTNPLLFIGYSLEDINFRIILKSINLLDKKGVAVLLPPKNKEYLAYQDQYLKHMLNVRVYWQEANEFSKELRQRWDKFQSSKVKK